MLGRLCFARGVGLVAALAGAALAAHGCGRTVRGTYVIDIRGPEDMFRDAAEISLELGSEELDRKPVKPGAAAVDLSTDSVDPERVRSGAFRIRLFDAQNKLVGFGQSPEVEIRKIDVQGGEPSPLIRIIVQRPGSIVRGQDLSIPVRNHIAVNLDAPPSSTDSMLRVGLAVFGTGEERLQNPSTNMTIDAFSSRVYVYNPYTHFADSYGEIGTVGQQLHLRSEAAALARGDGRVLLFGGVSRPTVTAPTKLSAQLDVFRIVRDSLLEFRRDSWSPTSSTTPGVARARTVIAAAGADHVYAIGGRGDDGPLDSIVRLVQGQMPALMMTKMAVKREGLTATTVARDGDPEIFIFGGAFEGPPAEVLTRGDEPTLQEVMVMGDVGPLRRDHVALLLPESRGVLILGGVDEKGAPVEDNLMYLPRQRLLTKSSLRFRTPRSGFTAFWIKNDIVVFGGRDAMGKLLDTAELYDVETLAFVAMMPCHARARATATLLANESVVLIGGDVEDKEGKVVPSAAIEVYQPRR